MMNFETFQAILIAVSMSMAIYFVIQVIKFFSKPLK